MIGKELARAVRDAQETLDGYVADQQRLTVTAPFAGILRYSGLELGDLFSETANKNVVFAELHRAAHLAGGAHGCRLPRHQEVIPFVSAINAVSRLISSSVSRVSRCPASTSAFDSSL